MHVPLYVPAPYQDSVESGRLILRDGSTATIRIAAKQDLPAIIDFFNRLSPESRRQRFFSVSLPTREFIESLCDSSEPASKLTLVITRGFGAVETVVAAGSYLTGPDKSAEVAFAVDDRFQGKGIGAQLLERLALLATRVGITRFRAVTQIENRAMIEVFRQSGFPVYERLDRGYLEVDFSVLPTEASVHSSEMRDRVFTAASLRPFFKPSGVAVVGASRESSSIGRRILEALVGSGFKGPIYPVNPKANTVGSLAAYPSVAALPQAVDLAIVAVPRDAVMSVVDACAERGVRALVVITAGFAEVDANGRALQKQLVEKVRGHGMRMIGPNCMGLIDTGSYLNASFSTVYPPAGRIAMSSQSGALGLTILALAVERGLGISGFVSVGNKADVSGNDLLEYWEVDPDTNVILLYLESFGNPRRFARIARRVGREKPIVAVKAGRTSAGRRAAGSHTAALAANDVAVDALFRQTGVIRAETLDEMFELAAALEAQPLISGRRVGIITNAGGPGILCTDACEGERLTVPEFSEETKAQLRAFLPASASVSNPVDMIASAGADSYRRTIRAVLPSPDVDAIIVLYAPVDPSGSEDVRAAIGEGVRAGRDAGGAGKPVLVCSMTPGETGRPIVLPNEVVPSHQFPESAAKVLSRIADYSEWRAKPLAMIPGFSDIQRDQAKRVVQETLQKRGPGWLSVEETRALLDAYRIPQSAGGLARTADEAVSLARKIGFPVAAKLASSRVLHKSDVGAIRLNLADDEAVRQAFEQIKQDGMDGILVQRMINGGIELMIGVAEDSSFGPLVGFGLGGIHVEILADIVFRVTPLTDQDAYEMVRGIRGYRLLEGYRGHPPGDVQAVEEVLLRVSRMVEDIPEVRELDLNPIFALPPGEGCSVVDARVRIG